MANSAGLGVQHNFPAGRLFSGSASDCTGNQETLVISQIGLSPPTPVATLLQVR
jgi:hypothetical protein